MFSNDTTDLAANGSSKLPAEFFCPQKPIFTWILSDATTFKVSIVTTSIACPITILLNIGVIFAVMNRRELKTNSNIVLANLAAADLIVGAVSMPLSVGLDALLLQKDVGGFICKIALVNQIVLHAASSSSLYHLTVIAWERYVAIRKPYISYKLIVTPKRLKWFVGMAWLLCVLTTMPVRIMKASNVNYIYIKILEPIFCLPSLICLVLIGYYYVMVYLGVRKRKVDGFNQQGALRQAVARRKRGIAKKVFAVIVVLLIFYVPSFVVLLFGEVLPNLRTSPFFRLAQLLTQLNSLMNPILYCFLLKRFRKAVLEMLKICKPTEIELTAAKEPHRWRVRRVSLADDVENASELQGGQQQDVFACGVESCVDWYPLELGVERSPTNSVCKVSQILYLDKHHPKPYRKKLKSDSDIEDGPHISWARRNTWNEAEFVEVTSTRVLMEGFDEKTTRLRSNTMPGRHIRVHPSTNSYRSMKPLISWSENTR